MKIKPNVLFLTTLQDTSRFWHRNLTAFLLRPNRYSRGDGAIWMTRTAALGLARWRRRLVRRWARAGGAESPANCGKWSDALQNMNHWLRTLKQLANKPTATISQVFPSLRKKKWQLHPRKKCGQQKNKHHWASKGTLPGGHSFGVQSLPTPPHETNTKSLHQIRQAAPFSQIKGKSNEWQSENSNRIFQKNTKKYSMYDLISGGRNRVSHFHLWTQPEGRWHKSGVLT